MNFAEPGSNVHAAGPAAEECRSVHVDLPPNVDLLPGAIGVVGDFEPVAASVANVDQVIGHDDDQLSYGNPHGFPRVPKPRGGASHKGNRKRTKDYRASLSLQQKIDIVKHKRLNPKKSLSDISEWCREIFQMSKAPAKATLSSIVRNGDTWLREGMEATNPQKFLKRKRRANSGIDALEERLALWARRAELEKFRPPTDRELLTQAQALAAEDGLDKFVDSQEWLLRFKRRYETDRAQLHQAYVTGASGMAAGSGLAPIPPGMLLLTPRLAPTGAHSRGIEIIGPYPELGLLPGGMSSTPRGLALGAQTPPQARLEPRLSGQAQVAMWLREFGLGDEVLRRFEAEDMDADALTEATEEELESMGVRKMGHRKKLLKWARAWAATM